MLFVGRLVFKRHTYSHSQEKIFKMTLDKNEITSKNIAIAKLLFKYYKYRLKCNLSACGQKYEMFTNKKM